MLKSESNSIRESGRGATRPGVFISAALATMMIMPLSATKADTVELSGHPELTQEFAVTSFSGGRRFLVPQALYVDPKRGDVYVADTGNGRIVLFDSVGQVITYFNHRPLPERASEPVGVAVDSTGRIFVTDTSSHHIHVYDFRGRPAGSIASLSQDTDARFGRMTVDAEDNLYVVVRNRGQVWVYDAEGSLKSKIGAIEDQSSTIEMASDVALDVQGNVYILSSRGTAVHVFAPSGGALLRFGEHAHGPHNFSFPTAIDVDSHGRIWVVDSFSHSIKVFNGDGSFVTSIGGYTFPVDVKVLRERSRLFVLEKSAQRLSGYAINDGCTAN